MGMELLTLVLAFWNLIGPHANPGFTVVCESGGALVSGGFAVPAVPEHVAFGLVGEDAVEAFAVGSGNWWF